MEPQTVNYRPKADIERVKALFSALNMSAFNKELVNLKYQTSKRLLITCIVLFTTLVLPHFVNAEGIKTSTNIDTTIDTAKFYLLGEEASPDYEHAYLILKKLAEQGDTEAMILLGVMYANGDYVKKSAYTAYSYFTKASEGNSVLGKTLRAACFMKGIGVQHDREKAIDILEEAASFEAQSEDAHWPHFILGVIQDYGYLDNDRNPVKANKTKAFNYYKAAALKGNASAYYSLGRLILSSKKPDKKKVTNLYYKAAKLGSKDAQYEIGRLFYKQSNNNENRKKGLEFLEKAANLAVIEAIYLYGLALNDTENSIYDPVKSYAWLFLVRYSFVLEEERKIVNAAEKKLLLLEEKMDSETIKLSKAIALSINVKIRNRLKYQKNSFVKDFFGIRKFNKSLAQRY